MIEPVRDTAPRHTALHRRHTALGARFTTFAGWELPLQYGQGARAECRAVREQAGVFDVSHLGRVWIEGPGAGGALRSVTTYNVTALAPGHAHYSLYCNEAGGIEDDVFVYRLSGERWLVVHNAANAAADLRRLQDAGGPPPVDGTGTSVMLAVQGPAALSILEGVLRAPLATTRRGECLEVSWRGTTVLFARTGYTGEDGGELVLDAAAGEPIFEAIVSAGAEPAGLAARDILRLEAALPLHGNDIGPDTNPFEAGLRFAVSLDDAPFTGRDALRGLAMAPPGRKLSCIRTEERAVPRPGYPVTLPDGTIAAHLTSGAFSPTLGVGIGLAYLPASLATPGTELAIRIRSKDVRAAVVRRPFYRRR